MSKKGTTNLIEEKSMKIKKTKSFDISENKPKTEHVNKEIILHNSPDKTNDESLTINSMNTSKVQRVNPFIKIINDFYLNKINLTSTAQERVVIESLILAYKELTETELNESIYLVHLILFR
jgi:hypothetical protein